MGEDILFYIWINYILARLGWIIVLSTQMIFSLQHHPIIIDIFTPTETV